MRLGLLIVLGSVGLALAAPAAMAEPIAPAMISAVTSGAP